MNKQLRRNNKNKNISVVNIYPIKLHKYCDCNESWFYWERKCLHFISAEKSYHNDVISMMSIIHAHSLYVRRIWIVGRGILGAPQCCIHSVMLDTFYLYQKIAAPAIWILRLAILWFWWYFDWLFSHSNHISMLCLQLVHSPNDQKRSVDARSRNNKFQSRNGKNMFKLYVFNLAVCCTGNLLMQYPYSNVLYCYWAGLYIDFQHHNVLD